MGEKLKTCPFCGSKPEIKIRTFYCDSGNFIIRANVSCPSCICNTHNEYALVESQVQQSVLWDEKEILEHIPNNLKVRNGFVSMHPTTKRIVESEARRIIIEAWQRRI